MSVGQDKKLTTREDILNHPDFMNMLYWCAKKLKIEDGAEDIIQTTALHLCKYKICPENSVLSNIIFHMKWVMMRPNTKKILARTVNLTTGCENFSGPLCEDSHEVFEFVDEFEKLNIEPIQRQVLILYYREGKTLKEVGEIIGKVQERVRIIKLRAIEACREQMRITI